MQEFLLRNVPFNDIFAHLTLINNGYYLVRHELMNIVSVTQLEKDTILVCYDSKYFL